MMNLRVKFTKGYEVKYVSHLDLMRTFQRMLKRTGYKVKYSEGFNPHMNLTFALPLPVGVTSDGEYAEFSIDEQVSCEAVKERINQVAPKGIEIIEVSEKLTPKFKEIKRAGYTVTFETKNTVEDFKRVCDLSEILIEKKTKKGIKEVDIKPLVFSCNFEKNNDKIIMKLTCAAGSEENLNPDLLVKAFEKYIENCDISYYSIHRNELVFPVEYEF